MNPPTTLPAVKAIVDEAAADSPLWSRDRIGGWLRLVPLTLPQAVEAVRGNRSAVVRHFGESLPNYGWAVVEWEGGWGVIAPGTYRGGFDLITPAK